MSTTLLRGVAAVLAAAALTVATSSASPAQARVHHHSRPCFMVPAHWNVGLDGPLPRC